MMLRTLVLASTIAISACAPGTDLQLRHAEYDGQLQIDPVEADDHDYVVRVGNIGDIHFDPDVQETRNKIALGALRIQCPDALIVGETPVQTGMIPLRGKPAITYHIRVRCN